jgi:hypothetical protein
MSRKSLLYGYPIIPAGTNTGTGNYTSPVIEVAMQDQLSIHYVVSSSGSAGSMVVEVQNGDIDPWHAIDFGAPLDISTTTDNLIVLQSVPFTKLRMRITGTGSGTALIIGAQITSKSMGA